MVGVDLANEVIIKAKSIEVYPDEASKPAFGQKLNKQAIVTLQGGIRPKKGLNAHQYESQLQERIQKHGGVHLCYVADSMTWRFKAPHF